MDAFAAVLSLLSPHEFLCLLVHPWRYGSIDPREYRPRHTLPILEDPWRMRVVDGAPAEARDIVGHVEAEALHAAFASHQGPLPTSIDTVDVIAQLLGASTVREVDEGKGDVDILAAVIRHVDDIELAWDHHVDHGNEFGGRHFHGQPADHHRGERVSVDPAVVHYRLRWLHRERTACQSYEAV